MYACDGISEAKVRKSKAHKSLQNTPSSLSGILIPALQDTEAFTDRLCAAMAEMLAPAVRARYASQAARLGEGYGMGALAERYRELYLTLLRQAEAGLPPRELNQVAIAPGSGRAL